jgi:non-specific serine/threonine protein kinase
LFFISLKAGVGLNITKASYVLFWRNPFAEKQGIGRASYWTVEQSKSFDSLLKNTVEEKIIRLQETKKLLSDALLDETTSALKLKKI